MIDQTKILNSPQIGYRDYSSSITPNNTGSTNPQQSVGLPDCRFMGMFSFLSPTSKIQDPQEKAKYEELSTALDARSKRKLKNLLDTGKLLNKHSDDGSSTLDNLYKIHKEPRVPGIKSTKILEETINRIDNPFNITQKFGKIPDFQLSQILAYENSHGIASGIGLDNSVAPQFNDAQYVGPVSTISAQDVNAVASGTCVAASMEFNLADKDPAEYARYVAGLTSPDLSVKSVVNYKDIAPTMMEATDLLTKFGVEHKELDWDKVEVTLKPDRNAIVRARAENTYLPQPGQPQTRSTVDTLMQSTFMQVGSANSYNAMTDIRTGGFNLDNKGLTEFEKTFTESLVDDSGGKTSMTYQIVDDNKCLQGYNTDYQTVQKQLLDSLKSGSNVIIGITEFDHLIQTNDGQQYHVISTQAAPTGQTVYKCVNDAGQAFNVNSQNIVSEKKEIIGGHEMTVISSKVDKKGELSFICNDTDDDYSGPVEIKAKDLIPKIHHAGIPNKVLDFNDQPAVGDLLLKDYINMKQQEAAPQVAA